VCASKTRNSFAAPHEQAGVQLPPGKQGSMMHNLLGKTNVLTPNVPPFFLCLPGLYTEHDATRHGTSLWSAGADSPGRVPFQPLVHLQPARWWGEKRKGP